MVGLTSEIAQNWQRHCGKRRGAARQSNGGENGFRIGELVDFRLGSGTFKSMGAPMTFLKPYSPFFLSVFRVAVGLAFLQHGTTKYLSFPVTRMSGVEPFSMAGVAGMIELVCGALIVLGLFTRFAAFLASGTMAVAFFMVHYPQGIYPILNGGELAMVYCFSFLYLTAAGPGPVSLDRILRRD